MKFKHNFFLNFIIEYYKNKDYLNNAEYTINVFTKINYKFIKTNIYI